MDPSYVERHVHLFNAAVVSGDFSAFLATFAEDAVMRFEGVPIGPFVGRAAIAEAYRTNPPDDSMRLLSTEPSGDAVLARFRWSSGGAGSFLLSVRDGEVCRLDITFDPGDLVETRRS